MFFVRTASERDVERLRVLLAETFHTTYDPLYGQQRVANLINSWHTSSAISARIGKKGGEFLVADDGKGLAGMAYASMSTKMAKTAILYQLYVLPGHQRQGVGRDLFAELETCFPDAEIMRLDVEPRNLQAIAFYEGLGFHEVDRATHAGPDGLPLESIVMEKTLPA